MRTVLHLIDTGGPGGAETVFVDLVRRLDSTRWRSVVVLPNQEWMYDEMQAWDPAPVLLRGRGRVDIRFLAALRDLIRRERVDLVHAHLFGPAETASLLGLLGRVPAVATLHGQSDIAGMRLRRAKFALLNRGLRRVVFVSEALQEFFLGGTSLRPALSTVIPNGVDPVRFSPRRDPAFREELGIGPDEFVVGAVGNLREAKGYDVLLRAAALLRGRSPGWRFVVVGQAQGTLYRELLALRAELGVEECVTFAGFRPDVHRALASFDAYAITSRSEGFSLATVQAMASGLPVVATRCGGPEEIVDHGATGILVPNGSPEAVADALFHLRNDAAARHSLGEQARRVAETRYTVAAQVRAYERVYEEALSPGASLRAAAAHSDVEAATCPR